VRRLWKTIISYTRLYYIRDFGDRYKAQVLSFLIAKMAKFINIDMHIFIKNYDDKLNLF